MASDAFASPTLRGQFSGHETFPLRYGWLKKVADTLSAPDGPLFERPFDPHEAMAEYGVGKNMVVSMRHWSTAARIVEQNEQGKHLLTPLGAELFADSGLDPYCEQSATLWLLHWNIASRPKPATTWYWAFNHFNGISFERDQLVTEIQRLCKDRGWDRPSPATLRRDVDCFVRSYALGRSRNGDLGEDSLESPLVELELIVPAAGRGAYQFQRGPKASLPDEIFNFALWEYWIAAGLPETATLDTVTYAPGSPGRVFKLDDLSVAERIARIEDSSLGLFQSSETAGLLQVQRMDAEFSDGIELLRPCYAQSSNGQA